MIDFDSFIKWQRAKPDRHVKIELGDPCNKKYLRIWVYDYKIMVGQNVKSVEEIDLEEQYRKNLLAMVEEARKAGIVV